MVFLEDDHGVLDHGNCAHYPSPIVLFISTLAGTTKERIENGVRRVAHGLCIMYVDCDMLRPPRSLAGRSTLPGSVRLRYDVDRRVTARDEYAEPTSLDDKALYTIGHSNGSFARLVDLLRLHDVHTVVDVRSTPFSRYLPQFNCDSMAEGLYGHGHTYVHMGDTLGGRPSQRACYDTAGHVLCMTYWKPPAPTAWAFKSFSVSSIEASAYQSYAAKRLLSVATGSFRSDTFSWHKTASCSTYEPMVLWRVKRHSSPRHSSADHINVHYFRR